LLDRDAGLNAPDVLPAGNELARPDPGPFKLHLPGGKAWVRVTTDAEVFDHHARSHEFLSPGGGFSEGLATPNVDDASAPREGPGRCWLVEQDGEVGRCEMFVGNSEGPTLVRVSHFISGMHKHIVSRPPRVSGVS
jgi:hypothetical protein